TIADPPATPGAYQAALKGGKDISVTKMNATGTGLIFSTFLGGSGDDTPSGIAIDGRGNVYVAGTTDSADFPVTRGAAETVFGGGGSDGFITKLNPNVTALVYSTFIGGSDADPLFGLAVDGSGAALVVGGTNSANFPLINAIET